MRILVIGAGPAGTRCAVRLAERLPGSAVTLAGAEAALPYDRVALSKLLAGDATIEGLITHPLAMLRGLGIAYRPATPIAAIDRAAGEAVTTRGERLGYDRLVLATGSSAIRLPLPGAALPGVVLYRDMDDVRAMLRAAAGGGAAVVIGGGLLGLEAAVGLAARGHEGDGGACGRLADGAPARPGGGGAADPAARRARHPLRHAGQHRGHRGRGPRDRRDGSPMGAWCRPAWWSWRSASGRAWRWRGRPGCRSAAAITVDDAMRTEDPAIYAIGECAEHQGRCHRPGRPGAGAGGDRRPAPSPARPAPGRRGRMRRR